MARVPIWVPIRSIPTGWAALLLLGYVTRALLLWCSPLIGISWVATARLTLDCAAFAATGWLIGYLNRTHWLLATLAFAATLCVWDFTPLIPVDVPWLFRLIVDTFEDGRFFDSLVTAVATHALLFGCLISGARLALPREAPASLKL